MRLKMGSSYVDRRVFAALTVLALFSVVTTIVTIDAVARMTTARQWGVTYSMARTTLSDLQNSLATSESAQRGYLLTGDEAYLAPYNAQAKNIPLTLSLLQSQLAGTRFAAAANQLNAPIHDKLAELAATITAYRSTGLDAALAIVGNGRGQTDMASIRGDTSRLSVQLSDATVATRSTIDRYSAIAKNVGILALAGTLILVIGIYLMFNHAIEAERALDRAKDEFVALASHQLRTPATGIKSILSMLAAGDFGHLSERQQSVVAKAVQSNERELNIIEELLNVAKADAGRLVLNSSETDFSALVHSIISEQQTAIKDKDISVELQAPEEPIRIVADEEKLYMAISNLIDNARKYTPESGRIHVNISGQRAHVTLEVVDTGIGIAEDELVYIFDRFQRSRMVLAGTIEGTGLGLYLARRIAELHHGTISVDSKKGHGSRFTLVLPRKTSQ